MNFKMFILWIYTCEILQLQVYIRDENIVPIIDLTSEAKEALIAGRTTVEEIHRALAPSYTGWPLTMRNLQQTIPKKNLSLQKMKHPGL